MASATPISLAEYLDTSYGPDREYLDGEVRERNVGKREHVRVQAWLMAHETVWLVMVVTEARLQVAAERVRIPDRVLTSLALQAEMADRGACSGCGDLSPKDMYSDTELRATDYSAHGCQANVDHRPLQQDRADVRGGDVDCGATAEGRGNGRSWSSSTRSSATWVWQRRRRDRLEF